MPEFYVKNKTRNKKFRERKKVNCLLRNGIIIQSWTRIEDKEMDTEYLIHKKPLYALILFSIPMALGNLFQQLYNTADSAVVGRYVSEQALAAVGASYSLTAVFIGIAMGGGIGASVIISQYFGAREYAKMKKAIFTAFLTFLAVGILLGIFGLGFSRQILVLLNTPYDALDMAVTYLKIYFIGLPFLFMYNIISSMFNALGDSKTPLAFLIFSSVFNIILDVLLVKNFQMGVAGVAWATFIAQGISAVLSFLVFVIDLRKLYDKPTGYFDKNELKEMTSLALPSILQQTSISVGMLLVQSVVNGFGSQALAGFTAAIRVEVFCLMTTTSVGNALSSYVAQNIGAGKLERVKQGYYICNTVVVINAVISFIILQLFHREIAEFFLGTGGTEVAYATMENYLKFVGCFFCVNGWKHSADGLLRGAGDMKPFVIANMTNLGIRVLVAVTMAPVFGIQMVWYAIPMGWAANFVISYGRYRTGKWKTIQVIKGGANGSD